MIRWPVSLLLSLALFTAHSWASDSRFLMPQCRLTLARDERMIPRESFAVRKGTVQIADPDRHFRNRIDLKLREGSGIRSKEGKWSLRQEIAGSQSSNEEIQSLLRVFEKLPRYAIVRMHCLPEAALESLKKSGEKNTGRELPDLNLWFHAYVDVFSTTELAGLIRELNDLDLVEIAYASPLPSPPPGMQRSSAERFKRYWREHSLLPWPTMEEIRAREAGWLPSASTDSMPLNQARAPHRRKQPPPPLPGDFQPAQDYGEAAPIGIDIDYVDRGYYNARGTNWGFTDVEYYWNQSHRDLASISDDSVHVNESPSPAAKDWAGDHGTAVIGQLSSDNNGWGTTGLVHDAAVRLSTEWPESGWDRTGAIMAALSQFWNGSVILLEMQTVAGFDCNRDGRNDDNDLVPAEWDPAVKSAIQMASANGRIIVEPAGNGDCDLDLPDFGGRSTRIAAKTIREP